MQLSCILTILATTHAFVVPRTAPLRTHDRLVRGVLRLPSERCRIRAQELGKLDEDQMTSLRTVNNQFFPEDGSAPEYDFMSPFAFSRVRQNNPGLSGFDDDELKELMAQLNRAERAPPVEEGADGEPAEQPPRSLEQQIYTVVLPFLFGYAVVSFVKPDMLPF